MMKSLNELSNYIFSSNLRTGVAVGLAALLALGVTNLAAYKKELPAQKSEFEILESYPTNSIIAKRGDTMDGLIYGSMQGVSRNTARAQFQLDNETVSDHIEAGKTYTTRIGTNYTSKVRKQ